MPDYTGFSLPGTMRPGRQRAKSLPHSLPLRDCGPGFPPAILVGGARGTLRALSRSKGLC